MKTLQQLLQERAQVLAEMRALHDAAKKEERGMNGEETAKFDALDKKQAGLKQLIDNERRFEGFDDEEGELVRQPVEARASAPKAATSEPTAKGFASFGEQLLAIRAAGAPRGHIDPRLETRAATGSSEEVPSDGGFLVQKDFLAELMTKTYAQSQIAQRCRRVPVSGNGLKVNGVDETSRATGSRWGGIRGYWAGEADQKTASQPKFRRMEMTLQKLIGLWYATDELLEDATALDAIASQAFADEFSFLLDDAVLSGDGVGKPLGILNSPSLISQAAEGGQTADTIVFANIVKQYSRLWARSMQNAVYLANQDIIPQLFQMKFTGTATDVPVYLPANAAAGQPFNTLFGKPILFTEQNPTLGDVGDLLLTDLSQYMLIEKGGIKSDVSIHVRFIYDESVFRFVMRVNGQPIWHSPLTPFKGTATVSTSVAIAAR